MWNQSRSPAADEISPTFQSLNPGPTSYEQQLLAERDAAVAQNKVYEAKLWQFQRLVQGTGPVQEAFTQHVTAAQASHPESTPPTCIYPNARIVMHDEEMMIAASHLERGFDSSAGQEDTINSHTRNTLTPELEWCLDRVRDTESMDDGTRTKVLLQTVKQYQDDLKEKKEKLEQRELHIHNVLCMHQAIVTKLEEKIILAETALTDAEDKLEEEKQEKFSLQTQLTRKHDTILDLQQQLERLTQQQNNLPSQQTIQLRAGVKRGRFLTSRPVMMECANCGRMFLSEQDASQDPVCSHHTKAPCKLTIKRMMEMFPDMSAEMNLENKVKRRYWPCCKQVGSPTPCRCGVHDLRRV